MDDTSDMMLDDYTLALDTPLGDPSYTGSAVSAPPTIPAAINPTVQMLSNLLGLLMLGGGAAGVGQGLFGAPPTTITRPQLSPAQQALLGGAQGQFGQSGGILAALMGALGSPQIPSALSALTEQAFRPQFGDVYQQAVRAGRARGFYDAPATSPPGSAVLGPALSNLQGQMAQAKLGLYQNNIGNFLQALQASNQLAGSQGTLATGLPTTVKAQAPKLSILQLMGQLAPVLGGAGQLLAAVNPAGSGGGGSLMGGLSGLWDWATG